MFPLACPFRLEADELEGVHQLLDLRYGQAVERVPETVVPVLVVDLHRTYELSGRLDQAEPKLPGPRVVLEKAVYEGVEVHQGVDLRCGQHQGHGGGERWCLGCAC